MSDPLADVVTLLQPVAKYSKLVEGAGLWRMHRARTTSPFYCAVLDGACRISIAGQAEIHLQSGDFLLVPAGAELINASPDATDAVPLRDSIEIGEGHFRLGRLDGAAEQRLRIGHCDFRATDAALLLSVLPSLVHVRGEPRLTTLVQLVGDETLAQRPGRELVLERLLDVLLIEAFRCGGRSPSVPGLALGLADDRLAAALRAIHSQPERSWSVASLADCAALSRSAFFARFQNTVGVAPMTYLLNLRMALAKRLLVERKLGVAQIAERVGYGSPSTFSVAFMRQEGVTPSRFGLGPREIRIDEQET